MRNLIVKHVSKLKPCRRAVSRSPTAAKIQLNGMVEFTGRMSISEYVSDYIIMKELEKIKTKCENISEK